ncbi:bacillithiol biosynthesis cysteine-adding enzyme BshC [Halobacillus sp. Marseille-Q1614]|uniref:bacillithiol biosynthesis cysteine-adding enzyme BshC n=1 Tax=Halobacillus sp. Marseille-Q1614 TaxID=2709134 RepID=UPI00156FA490|nr:bacillithiol biosynthesis cysteine-adding enzyme BshC [Halobacillus sp. Marseille-Q1614]
MRIEPMSLPDVHSFVSDYKNNYHKVKNKFNYNPFKEDEWKKRLEEVQRREYQRKELVDVLTEENDRWGASEQTFHNIKKLGDRETTAVVAGQQAGLLTGPLYTVNKIISVLQLAKKKEKQLGVSVVPIFWIAGEDHDFAEINHIYQEKDGQPKKYQVNTQLNEKLSVSDLPFEKPVLFNWLSEVFAGLPETEHTNDLFRQLEEMIEESGSYTEFFAKIIHELFKESGLILMDAHSRKIRELESSYFKTLLQKNHEIGEGVHDALQDHQKRGYPVPLDSEVEDAHLFYHHQQERVLLTKRPDGTFSGKRDELTLTYEELYKTAEDMPWLLSNNVVSRPVMQELLLPVLAFIGGPGEINYWSVLKPAFEAAEVKMPPVVPRLSFTLADRKTVQLLREYRLNSSEVIKHGAGHLKLNWLASKSAPPIEQLVSQVNDEMHRLHSPLREKASEISPDIEALAKKNWEYIESSLEFLRKRMVQSIEDRYQHELDGFDHLQLSLRPNGSLQERVWNILPWINRYGLDLFLRINQEELDENKGHYFIEL